MPSVCGTGGESVCGTGGEYRTRVGTEAPYMGSFGAHRVSLETRRRPSGPGRSQSAAGGSRVRLTQKLTGGVSRSVASAISKYSRAVKPPWLATIEVGNCWILVLYAWVFEL